MSYNMATVHDLTNVQLLGYPLFLSNWPERLNETSIPGAAHEGVLWHYISPNLTSAVHIRMYIWHINNATGSEVRYPGSVYLGAMLRNPMQNGTLTVSSPARQVSGFGGDPLGSGICLAKAMLGNTLDAFTVNSVTPQTTREIQSWELTWQNGVGAVFDFTINSTQSPFQFELRTVASPVLANLPNLTGTPVTATNNGGGRGYWQNNRISADIAHGMAPANPGEHWTSTGGGPDSVFLASSSYDPTRAVNNIGNYGVVYDPITIKLSNVLLPPFTVRARLAARNTGAAYAGAVDRGSGTRGVPAISYNAGTGSGGVVFLQDISVPQGGAAQPWSFRLAHAGAATMPVSVLLSTL
jgi:hypothetical protein